VFEYGTTQRYQPITTTGLGVHVLQSSTWKTGTSWSRTTTSLTITDNGHGRSVGEWAIVRNTNVAYQDGLITAADTNTYTITCADTGAASGSSPVYTMGMTAAYVGSAGALTGITFTAPANWDLVIVSLRIHLAANNRSTTTFNVTVPKGNIGGNGPSTSMDNTPIPLQQVRQDSNTLASVGSTVAVNLSGDFGTFQFGALGAVTTGIHILANF